VVSGGLFHRLDDWEDGWFTRGDFDQIRETFAQVAKAPVALEAATIDVSDN